MRGSIVKRGVGYSYVLYLGRDEATGTTRQKWVGGLRTKRKAEAALTEALGPVQSGHFADPGRTTVREFLLHWLDSVTPSLRETTAASYRASSAAPGSCTPRLAHAGTPDQAARHPPRRRNTSVNFTTSGLPKSRVITAFAYSRSPRA